MNFNIGQHTIFLALSGSHAYGTATPTSDLDVKGFAIPPREYRYGFAKRFEQCEDRGVITESFGRIAHDVLTVGTGIPYELADEVDGVIYDIRKFMHLAAENNPNILEVLFVDEDSWLVCSDEARLIRKHKNLFLSKRVLYTFTGYAVAQIKKIERHRKWLLDPPKMQPTREQFGLNANKREVPRDQLLAATDTIKKLIDSWEIDFTDVPRATVLEVQARIDEVVVQLADTSRLTIDQAKFFRAGELLGYETNFLHHLAKEREYDASLRQWNDYRKWQETRNPARAALEAKSGYDCYLDDTEFLTEHGWRRYDDIADNDRLGTFNRFTGRVEYQFPTERVAKPYTGSIGVLTPRHSDCAVTLNHRMLTSPARRSEANDWSWGYDAGKADWTLASLQSLQEGHRSYFHVRRAADAVSGNVNVFEKDLIILGAYLSEGCIGKRLKSGAASVLRISQKEGNRLCPWMDRLSELMPGAVNRYTYEHDNGCVEHTWTIADRDLAQDLERECGAGSPNLRLPRWTLGLNTAQVRTLLDVMLAGDGTPHGDGWVYYTSSKTLADDLQILCLSSGIVSAVWGPYPPANPEHLPMFQVFIGSPDVTPATTVCLRTNGSQSCSNFTVTDARIVCFTVPNEVLITRRNGKVAIHGNTKHAMHLVRLLQMCREILVEGTLTVRRPNAAELLTIRDGAWSYERVMAYAKEMEAELKDVAAASSLPRAPDINALDDLCAEAVERWERRASNGGWAKAKRHF